MLGGCVMVAHEPLELAVQVRILASQPLLPKAKVWETRDGSGAEPRGVPEIELRSVPLIKFYFVVYVYNGHGGHFWDCN